MATKNPSTITGPHMEPPEQGGETYYRCEDCGSESIMGPDKILHLSNCPERDH